ncbi:MAG: spermidine synthase [Acidimicrobiia bacterium]|nr:spermidine synthase [Acidimicrobiia bacterium]
MRILAAVVFGASGFAALLYQVIWQRLLAFFSGADVYSATIIVAAFMAGLGIGHLAGGHLADRVSRRASLLLFVGAELAIAAFGAASAWFYYDVLYLRFAELPIGRAPMAAVLFVSLVWPTFFMGMSLPLLSRALTVTLDRAASTIGGLYGANTLGAALGALITTWGLLPWMGLAGSLRAGAVINLACAALFLPLALRLETSPAHATGDGAAGPPPREAPVPPAPLFWMVAAGAAGFVALSLEIVWFRLLGVMVKSSAFTFGTLLTAYLGGLGFGALAGSLLDRRVRRPGRLFLLLQAGAGLGATALLAALGAVAPQVPALHDYFAGYEPLDVRSSVHALGPMVRGLIGGPDAQVPAHFIRLYVMAPLVLITLPTCLLGAAFPFVQRVVQRDPGHVGRRVGQLLAANITGSLLGTVITGFLLLPSLGTSGTLAMVAVVSSVFAWFGIASPRDAGVGRRGRLGVPAAGLAALLGALWVAALPSNDRLWARLHGAAPERIVVGEDDTGLSVIRRDQEATHLVDRVFANGLGQSSLPYGGVHTALGALAVFIHPNPVDVAIVGLGSGDTAYAAAGRPDVRRIVSIEIIRPQLTTLGALAERSTYGALHALLADPRIEHIAGDGRTYLMRTFERFDVIEADALRPTSAFSGNLFSEEYFRLLRSRLKPGGLAVTWAPTRRVHDGFVRVFPHVLSVPGILVGSHEPITLDRGVLAERVADPRVREHFGRAGIPLDELFESYLGGDTAYYGPDFDRSALTDVNTDLFPRDEFDLSSP